MDHKSQVREFLSTRRAKVTPEQVNLAPGTRRRVPGLRREEVALLCHMSTDYYARLERERGPQPSEQMLASIAQGLHLSLPERDHPDGRACEAFIEHNRSVLAAFRRRRS